MFSGFMKKYQKLGPRLSSWRKGKSSVSHRDRNNRLQFELLEPRWVLDNTILLISEFMASNQNAVEDGDGKHPDWIEIYNPNENAVNLEGWHLTDNANKPTKWPFPAVTLPAGGYMVVFASGEDVVDYVDRGGYYHTNFKCEAAGEYLGLYRPDGSVAYAYAPQFPTQVTDLSYGIGTAFTTTSLVSAGAEAKVLVPTTSNGGSTLGSTWQGAAANEPFNDSAWTSGETGVGYSGAITPVGNANLKLRFNADTLADITNTVNDTSAANHDGTNVGNSVSWVDVSGDTAVNPLVRRGAMQFNAAENDQITVAPNADFNNSATGTISFWMRSAGTSGTGNTGAVLFDLRSSRGLSILQTDDGYIRVYAYKQNVANPVNTVTSTVTVSDDQWHLVTVTYTQTSGGYCTIYIDGVQNIQAANTDAWNFSQTQSLVIGQSLSGTYSKGWRKYNGLLDDYRFYSNTILSSTDIANIYNGTDEAVYASDLGLNLQSQMSGVNTSAFIRIPFNVTDSNAFSSLTLILQYNDGFVAWLNGSEIARANAPASIAWNSAATAVHSPSRMQVTTITVTPGMLRAGSNILAIQGLNNAVSDANFLVLPQLESISSNSELRMYFATYTPGGPNSEGKTDLGPFISDVTNIVERPLGNPSSPPLTITAHVTQSLHPVSSVTLAWRIMFASESTIVMRDDGTGGDAVAGDLTYTAIISTAYLGPGTGTLGPGEMLRWRVIAADTLGVQSTGPAYLDPNNSDQYYGTVALDGVPTQLSMVSFFVENYHFPTSTSDETTVDTDAGARGAIFYNGELYDNVLTRIKGYTTRYMLKRSHHVDFNSGHKFLWSEGEERVGSIAFNAEYVDPSYSRQFLAMWLYEQAGVEAPVHFPVRLQMNGAFWQLAFLTQPQGEAMLEQMGLDPDGALYKFVGTLTAAHPGQMEKQTRQWETSWADYDALAYALSENRTLEQRRTALFDMLDLPAIIDYLAVARITQEADDVWANMSLYRDSDGTLEWRVIPFDTNLSFGQLYYGDNTSTNGVINATDDYNKSHPLYGSSSCTPSYRNVYNRLYDAIIDVPETREMLLRRIRTLMDQFLQPPGTPLSERVIETKLDEHVAMIEQEANMDRVLWGWPPNSGPYGLGHQSFSQGISELKTLFLEPRRTHLYETHSVDNTSKPIGITNSNNAGIPHAQDPNVVINITEIDAVPVSGNQDEEYIKLTNPNSTAVDISGWSLSGAVEFTFAGGTIIPAGGSLYVSPNTKAFRSRMTGPTGGQNLFVVGPYDGHLSALGETIELRNISGGLVSSYQVPDTASDAQRYFRITEINYHPVDPPTGSPYTQDDFEFVEIFNTSSTVTVSTAGVHFSKDLNQGNGIEFNFDDSGVTSLAPRQYVIVAKNPGALATLYDLTGVTIVSSYSGVMSNAEDKIVLYDAINEKIDEVHYLDEDPWPAGADGLGGSLQRLSCDISGNDPTNWIAALPTLGASTVTAMVVNRELFYNNSKFDAHAGYPTGDPAANLYDDGAIATDKQELLPGQTATFANYTSYSQGINGVMVDIQNLANPGGLTAADFEFEVGNGGTWSVAPGPTSFMVRQGEGAGGSDRVTITWADNAIENQWLQIKVLDNANTGLTAADVFYFGNAIGESGDNSANAVVNGDDELGSRTHKTGFSVATITNLYDYNRDGKVNATDDLVARHNISGPTPLQLISVPAGGPLAAQEFLQSVMLPADPFSTGTASTKIALAETAFARLAPMPALIPPATMPVYTQLVSASVEAITTKTPSASIFFSPHSFFAFRLSPSAVDNVVGDGLLTILTDAMDWLDILTHQSTIHSPTSFRLITSDGNEISSLQLNSVAIYRPTRSHYDLHDAVFAQSTTKSSLTENGSESQLDIEEFLNDRLLDKAENSLGHAIQTILTITRRGMWKAHSIGLEQPNP